MSPAASRLDRPAARMVAAAVAALALGLVAWLVYADNRQDTAVVACIKQRTAAVERARDQGVLPQDAAQRFLAKVAESCAAQIGDGG